MSAVRRPAVSAASIACSTAARFRLQAEAVRKQHRRRRDRADRIGDVLARDVRRRAVNGLEQAGAVPQARRRQQAERPHHRAGLVREDVAEHVLGEDRRRTTTARSASFIAQVSTSLCVSVTSGILARHLGHDLPPESRDLEHVGLVDRRHAPAPQTRARRTPRARSARSRCASSASCCARRSPSAVTPRGSP